ncbi:MAG: polysaccharide deacetylase family protein [Deltaproteobacteria bacterium]|nr:polysaccharide deacetylase family protein [Deltaproteobacteria bacterium]
MSKVGRYAVFTVDVEKPYPDGEKGVYDYLEIFEKHGIKATFFMSGDVAEDDPKIVEAILQKGHEISSHGWRHPGIDLPMGRGLFLDQLSHTELRRHVKSSKEILQDIGTEPLGFRAPSFRMNEKVLKVVAEYFTYDSSLTKKEADAMEIPVGLQEVAVSTLIWAGFRIGTPIFFGYIPKAVFRAMMPFQAVEPLVMYGHSFDFIPYKGKIHTSRLKKRWYYDTCNPNRTSDVGELVSIVLDKGLQFVRAVEIISNKSTKSV